MIIGDFVVCQLSTVKLHSVSGYVLDIIVFIAIIHIGNYGKSHGWSIIGEEAYMDTNFGNLTFYILLLTLNLRINLNLSFDLYQLL